jgi:Mrp family chromosome partitioning ATPase
MDVLFAGPRPPDPSDLLQSQRMAEFLREVQAQYDLVVIDTPPAAVVSDAIPLITLVGGVVVVCRLGTTMRDHARRLRQQLDHLEAPVLGIVVNSAGEAQPYAYGYVEGDRALAPAAARRSGNARAHDDGDRSPVVAGEPGSENASARPAPAEAQRPGEWLE